MHSYIIWDEERIRSAIKYIKLFINALMRAYKEKSLKYLKYFFIKAKPNKKYRIFGLVIRFPENAGNAKEVYTQLESFSYESAFRHIYPKQAKVLIDCGASYGIISARFATLFPNAKIISIEPNPVAVKYASSLFKENQLNIELLNIAVSDRNGRFPLFVNPDHLESASFMPNARNRHGKRYLVKCKDFVELLRERNITSVDFLKMDIEGSEFNVLKNLNSARMLEMFKNMFIEIHVDYNRLSDTKFSDILHILELNGFYFKIQSTGSDSRYSRHLLWASKNPIVT